MKTIIIPWLIGTLSAFTFMGCDDDEVSGPADTYYYDFEQDAQGWLGGLADFPEDWDTSRFEFEFSHADLPPDVGASGKSLRISGRNISDDLFLFIKRQLTGLRPNHTYQVTFQIEFASQYPEQSVGIGGSPGASVYLKAGGSPSEPIPIEEGDYIRMSIDKGGQSQGGEDMVVLGNVGIPGEEFRYQLITRDNLQNPISITTDSNGSMWLIIGTDSGFEGTTTLYYNTIDVELRR